MGADIYGLHFQGDCATIKDMPVLNILAGGGYLPVSVPNIVNCTGHITSGHKKAAKFVAGILFHPMSDLDPGKKLVYLHIFDKASGYRKAEKIEGFLSYAVMFCWRIA